MKEPREQTRSSEEQHSVLDIQIISLFFLHSSVHTYGRIELYCVVFTYVAQM